MSNEKKNVTEPTLQPKRAAKRVIIPNATSPDRKTHSLASTDMLLNDAKLIIQAEIARYRDKAVRGISLDLKEARVVSNYLSELTKLQKEEREQARSEDLSNLSDEELLQLASQVLNTNKLIE